MKVQSENGVQLHGNALDMPNMTRGSPMFISHVGPTGFHDTHIYHGKSLVDVIINRN